MLYCEVFRLSNDTTFDFLLRKSCDYWGLIERNYGLFAIDERNKPVDLQAQGIDNVIEYVDTDYRAQVGRWNKLDEK